MTAPLYAWPWEFMGSYKVLLQFLVSLIYNFPDYFGGILVICSVLWQFVLYGIFLAKAMYSKYYQEVAMKDSWSLHIFLICVLRVFMYQGWTSYANMLFFTRNRLIIKKGVDFKQIDKEWHWYDSLSNLNCPHLERKLIETTIFVYGRAKVVNVMFCDTFITFLLCRRHHFSRTIAH